MAYLEDGPSRLDRTREEDGCRRRHGGGRETHRCVWAIGWLGLVLLTLDGVGGALMATEPWGGSPVLEETRRTKP